MSTASKIQELRLNREVEKELMNDAKSITIIKYHERNIEHIDEEIMVLTQLDDMTEDVCRRPPILIILLFLIGIIGAALMAILILLAIYLP